MSRFCSRCNLETDSTFCPECKSLTGFKDPSTEPAPKSSPGEAFDCKIWQGSNLNRGIRIGLTNRNRYFSKAVDLIVLNIEGVRCLATIRDSFWKQCPEIRVAKDESGKNYLDTWIRKHNLLPPDLSVLEKGREDYVMMKVIEPENEFNVFVPKEG